MKLTFNNLGTIRHGELELGELTILCGRNNTGKTYATHATFAFFEHLHRGMQFPISTESAEGLLKDGALSIDLASYGENLQKYIDAASDEFSRNLYKVFAGSEKNFEKAELRLEVGDTSALVPRQVVLRFGTKSRLHLDVDVESRSLNARISVESSEDAPPVQLIRSMLSDTVRDVLIPGVIPRPFLASAERTGAAIFQKELDFTRNRLLELLGDKNTKFTPIELLSRFGGQYPIAVRRNVDFIRELSSIVNREGYLAEHNPEILAAFADIIGGEYRVSKDGEVQFIPEQASKTKLSLVESSSAVRSLLDIGFYLRHVARPGDLLMIDEPELNLHPHNQRRIARLLAQLVNMGIGVFITTHSDFIVKELNTLIMFNQDDERIAALREKYEYSNDEMLDAGKVRVYVAAASKGKMPGKQRASTFNTISPSVVDPEFGIEVNAFDTAIDEMNEIQDAIVWGGKP